MKIRAFGSQIGFPCNVATTPVARQSSWSANGRKLDLQKESSIVSLQYFSKISLHVATDENVSEWVKELITSQGQRKGFSEKQQQLRAKANEGA
eukprot:2764342-Pleurochrysis_carterae.AAC.1